MWKPKKYKFILWDIDDTLIDFKLSEKVALKRCFGDIGVDLSDDDVAVYSGINHGYWLKLEKGEITKAEVLIERFRDFAKFKNLQNIDCEKINSAYQIQLGETAVLKPHGGKICKSLKGQVYQCAVTNGTKEAQDRKLKLTGLVDILDDIFISERIGIEKPKVEFFEHCFSKIPNFNKKEAIIIGDSLTSDMQGGNNAGIDCCWLKKPNQKNETSIKTTYEITSLAELENIL